MASRQFHLTEREVEAFRKAERTSRDVHERTRLQVVRLYGTGMATKQIMEVDASIAVCANCRSGYCQSHGLCIW